MASVTQTIPNFLGGVSNQPDDKKLPGQVREAINAYPDPTFGLTKRPGLKFITELADATTGGTAFNNTDLDDAKWFYMNRDADEKYVGCIVGVSSGSYGEIHVWNVAEVDGNGDYVKAAVTYGTNTREYLGKKFTNDAIASTKAADYNFLNVRDTALITNKNRVAEVKAGTTFNANRLATIRLSFVEYANKYEVTIKKGGTTYVCAITTRAGDTFANDYTTTNSQGDAGLNADYILTSLKDGTSAGSSGDVYSHSNAASGVNGISGITATIIGTTLELEGDASFTVEVSGGKNKNALAVYQDEVDGITELSSSTEHGRVVKIKNTFAADATYYAKFVAENGISGPGVWEEALGPGLDLGMDATTMPHRLRNTAKNAFTFEAIVDDPSNYAGVWGTARLVGDDLTNPHPSFKDSTIQQAFYYNNRIGFLTKDNVSLGQSGDYFNVYSQTAQSATASDPIDLSCSSIKEATLHGIIPSASGLLLFSQNQQFIMYSADGNLSPQTALIRGLSSYQMDPAIDPVDVGSNINFVSKTHTTAGYTRIFALLPQGGGQMPKVVDIGRVVSEYIPATITALTASPQNSFIAMYGKTDDKVYFYRTYSDGEADIIQCWFNWQLPGDTHFVEVDSDTFYTVVKTGTGSSARYAILSATLTQTPEETIIVTAAGQSVNPHMDFYTAATNGASTPKKVVYDTTGDFSKCYIPYSDITTLDPVIIIAGNGTQNFAGVTESGFTISPTRATDGDGTYFKVPGKDLSSQADNVYVGYKYNYDITLPKMYFRKDPEGRISDYTANLTVGRMKFSIGQSSIVGFKLKTKGWRGGTESFTGDGSTTAFTPTFLTKDRNDVKVKKNGAIQTAGTDYTIADHATLPDRVTVTFTTAPSAAVTAANKTTPADAIEIYLDSWYTLMPSQDYDYYLADDVPLDTQSTFTVPIHQRTDNYTLRVYSDSPFPLALTSATWEGTYSPRYYRRT